MWMPRKLVHQFTISKIIYSVRVLSSYTKRSWTKSNLFNFARPQHFSFSTRNTSKIDYYFIFKKIFSSPCSYKHIPIEHQFVDNFVKSLPVTTIFFLPSSHRFEGGRKWDRPPNFNLFQVKTAKTNVCYDKAQTHIGLIHSNSIVRSNKSNYSEW